LRRIWLDGGYRGSLLSWALRVFALFCKWPNLPRAKGFSVLAPLQVVERTFAWLSIIIGYQKITARNNNRRGVNSNRNDAFDAAPIKTLNEFSEAASEKKLYLCPLTGYLKL